MRGYSHGRRKTWPLQGCRVYSLGAYQADPDKHGGGRQTPSQRSLWGAERVPRLRVW